MSQFVMPSLGADMESAVLMAWHVKPGDTVKKGQVIAEVETSKGVIEIEVFEEGVVEKLLVEEETECAVGTPLALIATGTETSAPAETATQVPAQTPPMEAPAEAENVGTEPLSKTPQPETAPAEPESVAQPAAAPQSEGAERLHASPAARKKAQELGVELSALKGSGAVHLADVEAASGAQPATQASAHSEPIAPKPAEAPKAAGGMRQAIAKAMSRANAEIPHYYLETPINMTPALQWLETLNSERPIAGRILPAALLIRAVVKALQKVPELNGFWKDDAAVQSEQIHPGIAIALRKEGLITPALLNAETMDLEQTMEALGDLITRTRSGKLRGSELTSQTVTITNLGDLGVESVLGVIYPPQVALVGLGRIADAPWAEGDSLSVRKVMHATLAGDHRATDGRTGAQFLQTLNDLLQHPQELL